MSVKPQGLQTTLNFISFRLTPFKYLTQITDFANSVDRDEVAHDKSPHLDLHWLPSSL